MSTEDTQVTVAQEQSPTFQRPAPGPAANQGAVQIESERAIAEAQGQLVLAKRFPRDLKAGYAELMESCRQMPLAQVAFYSVPNRGSGISIRLAEEIARVFGNFEYGHRELSRSADKSEIEVFAWDKEKNNRSIRQITVMHVRDTKQGQIKLRDQKDIDDKIANVASKQVRGRILALVPKWFSEAAQAECRKTLAGESEQPFSVRVRNMVDAFAQFGVTGKAIEDKLGHKLDAITSDELIDMIAVYNALNEGAKVSEYFGLPDKEEPAPPAKGKAALKAALAKKEESDPFEGERS